MNFLAEVRSELESLSRCLQGEELVKALMERVLATEEEKATLASKVEELSKTQKEIGTLRKHNDIVSCFLTQFVKAQRKANEEHGEKLRELEKNRKDMIEQFKESVAGIQKSMESGRETSERLTNDNAVLSEKLKNLAGEYEARVAELSRQFAEKTEYCEKLTAARDMEVELYKTKLQAAILDVKKCTEEKLQLQNEFLAREMKVKEALEGEKAMREQIDKYTKKYNELHLSLNSSNETFDKFKREMERMNANVIRVEKDARKWKNKYEESAQALAASTLKFLAREMKVKEALEGEKAMREQIDKYTKKYNELHLSLNSSNETFDKFKREMERMNANVIRVEKDARKWKNKYEESAQALAASTLKVKECADACALKDRQLQQLQNLCRTLKSQIPSSQ
ncbi:unnamed protein product [Gongylonema pulchrum]|uniref:Alpha-taxilin n=1 Tax=Gongylonema pulchrum TaxID=637853 RepID=A0A183E0F6_9BILA|nr:unnamed protein product [Gongylonema pulchrum]